MREERAELSAKLTGTHAEKLAKVREIRDSIKERMKEFVACERSGAERPLSDSWERVSVSSASVDKP